MLDKHSPPVRSLLDDIDTEIARLMESLTRVGKSPEQHDVTRGQIKALRWTVKQIEGDPEVDELAG